MVDVAVASHRFRHAVHLRHTGIVPTVFAGRGRQKSKMPLDGGGGGYGDSLTGTNVRVMLLALRTQVYPVPPLAHPACFVRMVAVG
jgi:hypothetical protein